jgi:ribonuclease Z
MEVLNTGSYTLEGYAQGGIRTSFGVPELKILFDAGTPIPGCIKYKNIFITHGHPDHCGAITNIIARRSLQKLSPANVHVPEIMKDPLEKIFHQWWILNGGKGPKFPVEIVPVKVGEEIEFGNKRVIGLKTYHRIDSIGWGVIRKTKKLKPEFVGKDNKEIVELKKKGIEITDTKEVIDFTVPGDTTIDFLVNEPMARKAKVLIHEVTIWHEDEATIAKCRRYGHTHYKEMIEHCEKFEGEHLILCHRSMKHSRKFIENIVKREFPSSMKEKILIFDGGDR